MDKDMKYVASTMEDEGFHYCFTSYSDFSEVEDPEFHRLRLAYLAAAKLLEQHVTNNARTDAPDGGMH